MCIEAAVVKAVVKGFTLVELVIGIVVFSIVLAIITSLIVPQAMRSVDPIYQVRATELAQSLLNEITAKSFDENSDRIGGIIRCGDGGEIACTDAANLGTDGESRDNFDDVDDYHNFNFATNGPSLLVANESLYQGFDVQVRVIYDGNYNGFFDNLNVPFEYDAKLITISVTTPSGETLVFSAYRSNF
jgi:MSHA pilin protein MshD